MSTETDTTTQQEQGEWFVLHPDCELYAMNASDARLVFVHGKDSEDVERAMKDPTNVLLVEAYPKVVKALGKAANALSITADFLVSMKDSSLDGTITGIRCDAEDAVAALSDVHPERDKT